MLISEIEPINEYGVNLIVKDNFKDIIDKIIELPLQNACKIFREKGIETLMSSANKNNVLKHGEKPKEKEDVYGKGQQWFWPRPTYEDAGRGYAWIMLNFETLSDENKDWLFSLEEREKEGDKIGERAIWFVLPDGLSNLQYDLKVGKYDYDFLEKVLEKGENVPQNIQVDERLVEFDKRHIVLGYNSDRYPRQTVILRMPVNEQTTVEEVDEYFSEFARSFRSQIVDKKIEEQEDISK